jgi:dTDP-4-amino-4,6-dideoxygalactose transaminase
MLVGGVLRQRFTEALSNLSPSISHCALFSSGRAAIRAALQALRLPTGSGVIVQTYVCEAVLWAIRAAGCRPVLSDIADGWVNEPGQVETVRDTGCAAILLAPPFGFLQTARPFRHFGLPIIHDLCQASPRLLTTIDRAELGDIVALSFHPTKYLCAVTGGAALDVSGRYGDQLRQLEGELDPVAPFSEVQAAVGLQQLARLPSMSDRRERIANRYLDVLPRKLTRRLRRHADVALGDLFRLPLDICGQPVEPFMDSFAERGVMARRGVDQLAHRLIGLDEAQFPNSLRAYRQTLSLPFHASLSDHETAAVVELAVRLLC